MTAGPPQSTRLQAVMDHDTGQIRTAVSRDRVLQRGTRLRSRSRRWDRGAANHLAREELDFEPRPLP
jgi:hypothetical protein